MCILKASDYTVHNISKQKVGYHQHSTPTSRPLHVNIQPTTLETTHIKHSLVSCTQA